MGCSCSSKTISCIRVDDNPKQKLVNDRFCSITFENDSLEQVINLGVWTNSSSLLDSFFTSKLFVQNYSMSFSLRFNLIPLAADMSQILDGLLFVSEKKNEKEQIRKLSEKHSRNCLKFLLCPNNSINLSSSAIKTVKTKEEFLYEFANDLLSLENHIKDLFRALDKNSDGFIQQDDLSGFAFQPKIPFFASDLADFFSTRDPQKQLRLDYSAFLTWFKRGRLGAVPLVDLTKKWFSEVSFLLPSFNRNSENLMKESSSKKTVVLNPDKTITAKSEVRFFLGNSGKREFILRQISNLLDLNIYELWIACRIEYKSELQAKYTLCSVEDLVESLRSTLMAHVLSDNDLEKFIITKVKSSGSQINLSLAFDVNHDSIEEALFFVQDLDEMLRSPKDDYLEVKISSSDSLQDLKNCKSFKQHSESSKLSIFSETWKKFSDFLRVRTFFDRTLKTFLELDEMIELKPDSLEEFPALSTLIRKFFYPLQKLWKISYQLKEIVKGFECDLLPKIEFFVRIGNYGVCLEVTDEEIHKLFESD